MPVAHLQSPFRCWGFQRAVGKTTFEHDLAAQGGQGSSFSLWYVTGCSDFILLICPWDERTDANKTQPRETLPWHAAKREDNNYDTWKINAPWKKIPPRRMKKNIRHFTACLCRCLHFWVMFGTVLQIFSHFLLFLPYLKSTWSFFNIYILMDHVIMHERLRLLWNVIQWRHWTLCPVRCHV